MPVVEGLRKEIWDFLRSTGQFYSKIAIIPDDLFARAQQQAKECSERLGAEATKDVWFEERMKLLSSREAVRRSIAYEELRKLIRMATDE